MILVVHYPSSWLCGTWTDADPCPSTAQYTYTFAGWDPTVGKIYKKTNFNKCRKIYNRRIKRDRKRNKKEKLMKL